MPHNGYSYVRTVRHSYIILVQGLGVTTKYTSESKMLEDQGGKLELKRGGGWGWETVGKCYLHLVVKQEETVTLYLNMGSYH